mmetsp:Transcript_1019/g.2279  ORF Transcript_1019/g.2279 Transcript_1019/m.2279 type:complete len:205 (+) Transcript_1019:1262-1876(+)
MGHDRYNGPESFPSRPITIPRVVQHPRLLHLGVDFDRLPPESPTLATTGTDRGAEGDHVRVHSVTPHLAQHPQSRFRHVRPCIGVNERRVRKRIRSRLQPLIVVSSDSDRDRDRVRIRVRVRQGDLPGLCQIFIVDRGENVPADGHRVEQTLRSPPLLRPRVCAHKRVAYPCVGPVSSLPEVVHQPLRCPPVRQRSSVSTCRYG